MDFLKGLFNLLLYPVLLGVGVGISGFVIYLSIYFFGYIFFGVVAIAKGLKSSFKKQKESPSSKPIIVNSQEEKQVTKKQAQYQEEQLLTITYRDANGEVSNRLIKVEAYDRGTNLIKAYCYLRRENRTFRADRILSATKESF